jgi:hypothetical protein
MLNSLLYSTKDIPVKSQYFSENQDQNHSNVDTGLLHVRTNTLETLISKQAHCPDFKAILQHLLQLQLYIQRLFRPGRLKGQMQDA